MSGEKQKAPFLPTETPAGTNIDGADSGCACFGGDEPANGCNVKTLWCIQFRCSSSDLVYSSAIFMRSA